jgi:hypothetical protein
VIHPVAATRLIDAWDAGIGQHAIDRALTIAGCYTDLDRQRLSAMSIGERDALLLRIRRLICGDRLAGLCACVACGEQNEFDIDAGALPEPKPPPDGEITVSLGDRRLRARLPNSFDLAAVVDMADEEEATRVLVRRCLLADGELDEETVVAIDGAMEAAEGIAGLHVAFTCTACGAANRVPLDIAGFLWIELSEYVQRLIADVELLASCYGWSEADILAMSDRRRTLYAERVRR